MVPTSRQRTTETPSFDGQRLSLVLFFSCSVVLPDDRDAVSFCFLSFFRPLFLQSFCFLTEYYIICNLTPPLFFFLLIPPDSFLYKK